MYTSPTYAAPYADQPLQLKYYKGEAWNSMVEAYHGSSISEPILAEHAFALAMSLEVNMKEKSRSTMSELCIYKVKDGKIISEEFIM